MSKVATNGTVSTYSTGLNGPSYLVFRGVPEPSTCALLGLGGLALMIACRRKDA